MSATRVIRQDDTGLYLITDGRRYRPAVAFADCLDQCVSARHLKHLASMEPEQRNALHARAVAQNQHDLDELTAASQTPTALHAGAKVVIRPRSEVLQISVGPAGEVWAGAHPADTPQRRPSSTSRIVTE